MLLKYKRVLFSFWPCPCKALTKKTCPAFYPPQAQLDHTVLLVGRLAYIIAYSNVKKTSSLSLSVRVLPWFHLLYGTVAHRTLENIMVATKKIQLQNKVWVHLRLAREETGFQHAAALALREESSHQAFANWVCLWMSYLAGIFSGIQTCWYWHIPWHSIEYRLQIWTREIQFEWHNHSVFYI